MYKSFSVLFLALTITTNINCSDDLDLVMIGKQVAAFRAEQQAKACKARKTRAKHKELSDYALTPRPALRYNPDAHERPFTAAEKAIRLERAEKQEEIKKLEFERQLAEEKALQIENEARMKIEEALAEKLHAEQTAKEAELQVSALRNLLQQAMNIEDCNDDTNTCSKKTSRPRSSRSHRSDYTSGTDDGSLDSQSDREREREKNKEEDESKD